MYNLVHRKPATKTHMNSFRTCATASYETPPLASIDIANPAENNSYHTLLYTFFAHTMRLIICAELTRY